MPALTMTTADKVPDYRVYVDDNSHYMDASERYAAGSYENCEIAKATCRRIVDEFLIASYAEGMTAIICSVPTKCTARIRGFLPRMMTVSSLPGIMLRNDAKRFAAIDLAVVKRRFIGRARPGSYRAEGQLHGSVRLRNSTSVTPSSQMSS